MKCPDCNRWNEVDAKFCNYCGYDLEEDIPHQHNKEEKNQENGKNKTKTKKKNVTKTKKVKEKNKDRKQKDKRNKNDVVVVKKMSFMQKFMVFMLFLLFLCALGIIGFLGYHIYDTEVTEVPNVVGLTLEEGTKIMDSKALGIRTKEVSVEDKSEDGIILSQSIEGGTEVSKLKKIKLTVGVYKETLTMPDFKKLHIESVEAFLKEKGISYKITYQVSETSDGIVVDQSVRPNTKIEKNQSITLTVTKKKEIPEEPIPKEDLPEENAEQEEQTLEN